MYDYRKMTPAQRREAVEYRRSRERPWHSPPHWEFQGLLQFMISATVYEHKHVIGMTPERMTEFENALLDTCGGLATNLYGWCVPPNHYHVLLQTDGLKELRAELGKLHGRMSFKWNGEDSWRGRQVWHTCLDRGIKSHRHFWASLNYIHHNPVHHGYVKKWQDWPWSSAAGFIERVGRETSFQIWSEYPILDFGKTWDVD